MNEKEFQKLLKEESEILDLKVEALMKRMDNDKDRPNVTTIEHYLLSVTAVHHDLLARLMVAQRLDQK